MKLARLGVALLLGTLAATLLVAGHYYLALRLVLEPAWAEPLQESLLAGLVLLAALLVAYPFAERWLQRRVARWLTWPATLWMGLVFLLLTMSLIADLVLWSLGTPALAGGSESAVDAGGARVRALAVSALAVVCAAFGVTSALRPPRRERVEHRLARWPRALDGFRVVQISDLHIGPLLGRRFAEDLVARCNALEPDLIALTGDMVDGSVTRLAREVAPLAGLRAPHGVFFVTGNHDHYSGAERWAGEARAMGMHVLRNDRVTIEARGARFDLAGVDDHWGGYIDGQREDLSRALAGRDPSRALVLLAHDPTTFKRASRMGVDLQLSGHTHGGQIWPFRYLVRLAVPFVAGRYRRNGAQLYVSRGTGFWGPPMRLLAPAEITEHLLRSGG